MWLNEAIFEDYYITHLFSECSKYQTEEFQAHEVAPVCFLGLVIWGYSCLFGI